MLDFINDFWKKLTRYFMAGLLAVLPLVLTVAIVGWVVSFLRDFLGPKTMMGGFMSGLGKRVGLNLQLGEFAESTIFYMTGIVVVLAALFGLGVLVEMGAKRFFQVFLDLLLKKIPIVGSLYGSLKQLVELFDQPKETELRAMSVVFCYFGNIGGAGVLALMPSPEKLRVEDQDYHVVIIPTAPVPFGGGLIFFPADQVRSVKMSVDNFISIYVSMGVTTPEFMKPELVKSIDQAAKESKSESKSKPDSNSKSDSK